MVEVYINGDFLKIWRKEYRWPFCMSHFASEEKVLYLENLVSNTILKRDFRLWTVKDVLLEIVNWKTAGKQIWNFGKNRSDELIPIVEDVLYTIDNDPNNVSKCINTFLEIPHGVGLPVASALLRFLDPVTHRYATIDRHIAKFMNDKGITNFNLEKGYILKTDQNVIAYQTYHNWLHRIVNELHKGNSESGIQLTAVDIEMAIFAYTIHNTDEQNETEFERERSKMYEESLEKENHDEEEYEEELLDGYEEYTNPQDDVTIYDEDDPQPYYNESNVF